MFLGEGRGLFTRENKQHYFIRNPGILPLERKGIRTDEARTVVRTQIEHVT